jgi:hypothetical protein
MYKKTNTFAFHIVGFRPSIPSTTAHPVTEVTDVKDFLMVYNPHTIYVKHTRKSDLLGAYAKYFIFSNCTLCQKCNVDDSGLWLAAGRQMVADIE